MKTTIEIPDDLFRKAKATAAMQGRSLKDLITDSLRQGLNMPVQKPPRSLSVYDRMKDVCGIGPDVEIPEDFLTNPKYMDGFGE